MTYLIINRYSSVYEISIFVHHITTNRVSQVKPTKVSVPNKLFVCITCFTEQIAITTPSDVSGRDHPCSRVQTHVFHDYGILFDCCSLCPYLSSYSLPFNTVIMLPVNDSQLLLLLTLPDHTSLHNTSRHTGFSLQKPSLPWNQLQLLGSCNTAEYLELETNLLEV